MNKELAAPIEDVAFARVHSRGGLKFIGGSDEIAGFFLDFGEKVVEFGGVPELEERLDEVARVRKAIGEEIGEREVVAVIVSGRIRAVGAFEAGDGDGDFIGADVEFAEIVVGVVGVGFKSDGLFELQLGEIGLAELQEIVAKIGARRSGIGLEADGGLKVIMSLVVHGLRGIDEAEEFVDIEALRNLRKELLELGGGFGIVAGFVLGNGGLEVAIEIIPLGKGDAWLRGAGEKCQESGRHKISPESHDETMVAPGFAK